MLSLTHPRRLKIRFFSFIIAPTLLFSSRLRPRRNCLQGRARRLELSTCLALAAAMLTGRLLLLLLRLRLRPQQLQLRPAQWLELKRRCVLGDGRKGGRREQRVLQCSLGPVPQVWN